MLLHCYFKIFIDIYRGFLFSYKQMCNVSLRFIAVSRGRKMTICLTEVMRNFKAYITWFRYHEIFFLSKIFDPSIYRASKQILFGVSIPYMLMKIYFFEFHWWNLWTCSYTITRMISAKRFWFQGTKRNLLSLIRIKDILCRHFIPSNIYKSCNISGQDMQLKTFYMLENEKTFAFENTSKKKSGKIGSMSHPRYCIH